MQRNTDESLPNRHVLHCGISGSGKTQALASNEWLQVKNQCVILWDTHHSFKADHYDNINDLRKALSAAEKKGGGYRIAYGGAKSEMAFRELCRYVWATRDAKKQHVFVIDELASVSGGAGKDSTSLGDLLRETRKFNIIILVSATRPQEIPTTVITECNKKVVGSQGRTSDRKFWADFMDIKQTEFSDTVLKPLNFWIKDAGQAARLAVIKYKKPPL